MGGIYAYSQAVSMSLASVYRHITAFDLMKQRNIGPLFEQEEKEEEEVY